ncbi:MAG: hypothetical protein FD129_839 [bacterium]|nr:MAG: hypothetical protein FD129_839 [bacterium]
MVAITNSRSRDLRRAATGAGTPACDPPSRIHWSCSFTSWAVWIRSFGSLTMHPLINRSSVGGASVATLVTGFGSVFMIEPIRDAWLRPSNARLPVTAS